MRLHMNKYLLEIGVEELPCNFIPDAQKQLKSGFEKFIKDNGISFSSIKTFATPRRLTVLIDGLPDKKDDITKVVKGPISNIAYDKDCNLSPEYGKFTLLLKVIQEQLPYLLLNI